MYWLRVQGCGKELRDDAKDCVTVVVCLVSANVVRVYRQHTGIRAKLLVVGMTATEFSVAVMNNNGMLDY